MQPIPIAFIDMAVLDPKRLHALISDWQRIWWFQAMCAGSRGVCNAEGRQRQHWRVLMRLSPGDVL